MSKMLAVIPARSGSKGIPRKNMARLGDKSLIGHAASFACQHPLISHAVISTDDTAFAEEAKRYGVDCPGLRPPSLASDSASSLAVWQYALQEAEQYFDVVFDFTVLLEPTSPLRQALDLEQALAQMERDQTGSVVTLSRTPAHFTPHKALQINQQNGIEFYVEQGNRYNLRQSIPAFYHRNGIAYLMRRDKLLAASVVIDDDCSACLIERPSVNIDDEMDLLVAEVLMQRQVNA